MRIRVQVEVFILMVISILSKTMEANYTTVYYTPSYAICLSTVKDSRHEYASLALIEFDVEQLEGHWFHQTM